MTLQSRLDAVIVDALVSRIVGCVVLVRRQGHPDYTHAAGFADREARRVMREDAIFRLASVTKPIVAAAALRMADLGLLGLDDPVAEYLPWFTPASPDGVVRPILIRHLLTHTSGLGYNLGPEISSGLSGPLIPLEENLRRLAKKSLMFVPGERWEYGMSIDVLGGVIAAINGTDLAATVERYVTGPLGMTDTMFKVADKSRLTVPYADDYPPRRMGEPENVRDGSGNEVIFSPARILQSDASQSGGAGMAGTAADVMRFMEAIRSGDLLKPATRDAALANQIGALDRGAGREGKRFGYLGAVTVDPVAAMTMLPVGAVDWGGAWGHNWVIDRASGTSITVCTNTAFEGCNGPFREEVIRAVFGAG